MSGRLSWLNVSCNSMWLIVVVFVVLVVCILIKIINGKVRGDGGKIEGFAGTDTAGWAQVSKSIEGVRNDCLIGEEDARMKRLHRNMWMRGGNRVDDVANFQARIIGQEINEDTDKAQRKLTAEARKWALEK